MYTWISQFSSSVGQEIRFRGWVYNIRSSGKILFLEIRDGSGFSQAIVSQKDVTPEIWTAAESLTIESSVEIGGTISKHPHKEAYELQAQSVAPLQVAAEYPIGKKEHGPDFLLNNRHLWIRSPRQWAILRIRHGIIYATQLHLESQGFIRTDTPILTPTSCEDTTELFELDYFGSKEFPNALGKDTEPMQVGNKAYLAQSGQLYLEALAMSLGRVFDFGPVFRAEKSKTRRHLTEFWMMDAEAAFADFKDNMDIQEALIKAIVRYILERYQQELAILERDITPLQTLLDKPFIRMTHKEAVEQLHALGSDIKPDDDLGGDDETMLTKQFDVPAFISQYPAAVKAFYMQPDPSDASRVLCSDLLAPEGYGEIIGGSQRIHDYDLLLEKLEAFHLQREPFEWYLELRKYGSVPHSGFGYGLERIVGWVCGLKHVRETIPFPRLMNRLNP